MLKGSVFLIKLLTVVGVATTCIVILSWYFRIPGWHKIEPWLVANGTGAYGTALERYDGQFDTRLGCTRLGQKEISWTDLNSKILLEIAGPHSVKFGFYNPPTLMFSHRRQKLDYIKKILRLAYCGQTLGIQMGCDARYRVRGFQRLIFGTNTYQTILFECTSNEDL